MLMINVLLVYHILYFSADSNVYAYIICVCL